MMHHPELHEAPIRQYRTAREHACYIRRTDRAVVRVWGREPVKMVQGLITNDLAGAPEGQGVYAAMLTPKGKMIADLRAFRVGDEVVIDTDVAALDGVTSAFQKYVPPLFARWAVVEDAAVLGVYGPESRDAIAAAGLSLPPPDGAEEAFVPANIPFALPDTLEAEPAESSAAESKAAPPGPLAPIVVRTGYTGDDGYDVIGPASAIERLEDELGSAHVRRVDFELLEVLRIETGRPRWGAELNTDVIPLEADLLGRAISTGKGCYTGQEVIVRILHRGHVNRHLRGLVFDLEDPKHLESNIDFAPGIPIRTLTLEKRLFGKVTSLCISPRLGVPIGLALVRREVHPPAVLAVEMPELLVKARVVALPFPDPKSRKLFTARWPKNGNRADKTPEDFERIE